MEPAYLNNILTKSAIMTIRSLAITILLVTAATESKAQSLSTADQIREILRSWEKDASAIEKKKVRIRHANQFERWYGSRFIKSQRVHYDTYVSPNGYGETVLVEDIEASGQESVSYKASIRNSNYFSTLASRDGKAWRVESVLPAGESSNPNSVRDPWLAWPADLRLLWLAQEPSSVSWYRILQDSRYQFSRVETTSNRRRYQFTLLADRPQPPETAVLTKKVLDQHRTIRGGWFEVSGPHNRLDAYEFERSSPPNYKPYKEIGKVDYHINTVLNMPFAKRLEVETPEYTKRNGSVVRIRTVDEYEVELPTDDSESEFYLSHYGLPELPGITPPSRPTPTYVWLLLATGGLGILALASRWLLKRRTKANPAS